MFFLRRSGRYEGKVAYGTDMHFYAVKAGQDGRDVVTKTKLMVVGDEFHYAPKNQPTHHSLYHEKHKELEVGD